MIQGRIGAKSVDRAQAASKHGLKAGCVSFQEVGAIRPHRGVSSRQNRNSPPRGLERNLNVRRSTYAVARGCGRG